MKCKACGNPRTKKIKKLIKTGEKTFIQFIWAVCPKGHKYDMEED